MKPWYKDGFILGMAFFVAIVVVVAGIAISFTLQLHDKCNEAGGFLVRSQCFDPSAVIELD